MREILRGSYLVTDRIIGVKMGRPNKRGFLGTPKKEKLEEVRQNLCTDDANLNRDILADDVIKTTVQISTIDFTITPSLTDVRHSSITVEKWC